MMPNTHGEICPVCHGTGKYKEYTNMNYQIYTEKTCHGCQGKGWITVSDNELDKFPG